MFKATENGLIELTAGEAAAHIAIQEQHAADKLLNGYKDNRLAEYPSIGDQLDALFHAGVFPAEMAATIQAVKDKYPKS